MVVDEFALLLNLRDVYRSTEGRLSVDLALATIAVAVVYFAAKPFWRRLGRELALSLREHLSPRSRREAGRLRRAVAGGRASAAGAVVMEVSGH